MLDLPVTKTCYKSSKSSIIFSHKEVGEIMKWTGKSGNTHNYI